MSDRYGVINFTSVRDVAGEWGMAEAGEARHVREQVGAEGVGVTRYQLRAGCRIGFGHRHGVAEELYVVLFGDGRAKLDDDVIDLQDGDVLRVAPGCAREFEAGPAGLEILATGIHADDDTELLDDFWPAD
jgi:quercetin dioxygenase-like cupin family protein